MRCPCVAWGSLAHGRSMQSNPRVWQSPHQPVAHDPADVTGSRRDVGEDVVEGDGFIRIGAGAGGPVGDDREAGVVEPHFACEPRFRHAGHADEVAAVATHSGYLGAGFQPRPLRGAIAAEPDERDAGLAGQLARSSKDLEEHEYAVRSVADSLAPYCSSMNVPEVPFVLHLPNVMHLATDVAGVVHDSGGASVLELAAALHPSAAVGGTPTKVAVEMIAEIEGMDRGRYAGPVGWMDSHGDGEFGIALRSAEIAGNRVRLFAGCGIVADSDPEAELAEAQAKFLPVRDALAD